MSVVPYRPLGHIRDIVTELGLEVTYCYDDLVYVEHNAFLLRMGEQGDQLYLYFNTESDARERASITLKLQSAGQTHQINVMRSGTYTMTPVPESEHIQIAFHEGDQ